MGYMSLDTHLDSDVASDLAHVMIDAMVKVLEKGLKTVENCYNTDGPENVAMIFEGFVCPEEVRWVWVNHDELLTLARETIKKLAKKIAAAEKMDLESWSAIGDMKAARANRKEHLQAYARMRKALVEFVKFAEK